MWVRGMTRAGHSDCQGGLSAVQTRLGDDHDRSFRKQPPTASVRPFVVLQDWPQERAGTARKRPATQGRDSSTADLDFGARVAADA